MKLHCTLVKNRFILPAMFIFVSMTSANIAKAACNVSRNDCGFGDCIGCVVQCNKAIMMVMQCSLP